VSKVEGWRGFIEKNQTEAELLCLQVLLHGGQPCLWPRGQCPSKGWGSAAAGWRQPAHPSTHHCKLQRAPVCAGGDWVRLKSAEKHGVALHLLDPQQQHRALSRAAANLAGGCRTLSIRLVSPTRWMQPHPTEKTAHSTVLCVLGEVTAREGWLDNVSKAPLETSTSGLWELPKLNRAQPRRIKTAVSGPGCSYFSSPF